MKTFVEIRKRQSKGETVWSKKYKRILTQVQKTPKGFVSIIDGDVLDIFTSKQDAIKAIEIAAKELF